MAPLSYQDHLHIMNNFLGTERMSQSHAWNCLVLTEFMNSFVSFYFEIPCLASLLAFSIYTLFCFKRLSFRANKAPLFSVMSSNWAPNVRDTRSRITMDIIISASVVTTPKSPWFSAPSKLFVFCGQRDDLCWDCYLYLAA